MQRHPSSYKSSRLTYNNCAIGNKALGPTVDDLITDNYDNIIELLMVDNYEKIHDALGNRRIYGSYDYDTTKMTVLFLLFDYSIGNDNDDNLFKIVISKYLEDNTMHKDSEILTRLIECGYVDLFRTFLEIGNYNITFNSVWYNVMCCKNPTPFLEILSSHGHKMDSYHISLAIHDDKIDIVKYAIINNYDVQSAIRPECCSTFHCKISIQMLKLLLENNIDLSPIVLRLGECAIIQNRLEILKFLIDNMTNCDINNWIIYSCRCNSLDALKYLLQMGGDINMLQLCGIWGVNIKTVKFLIECNVTIDQEILNSLLIKSFTRNDITDIYYLVDNGADINWIINIEKSVRRYNKHFVIESKNYNNLKSPSEFIVSMGELDKIKYLHDNHYNLLQPEINRLFVIACANGQYDMANYLFGLDAKLDDKALISACFFGHLNIVDMLLNIGMNFDNINENMFDIVYEGSICGGCENVIYDSLIKDNDIFRNDVFNYGSDHKKIMSLLVKYNLPISINIGRWIVSYNDDVFNYFLDNIGDVNKEYNGKTILECCIRCEQIWRTKILLEHGAKINILDSDVTVLIQRNDELKQLFLEYGYVV
jgi:hypothetical protein